MTLDQNYAIVNVTWNGQNGDLKDPVPYDTSDADIRQAVRESLASGNVPGIQADSDVDTLNDYVVERFNSVDDLPNRILLRPKTPFGG